MKKLEKVWSFFVTMAALGIVAFWIAGFNGRLDIAGYCFFGAGISGFIALIALGLHKIRDCNSGYM